MSGDETIRRDPYHKLLPVLAGEDPPDDAGAFRLGEDVACRQVKTDRNLWSVELEGTSIVTLDADEFATTFDLGRYVDQVLLDVRRKAEAEEEPDDDPRRTAGAPSFQ